MHINRRQFLKYCIGSAAVLGLPMTVIGKLETALAAESSTLPKVIWLNGANCSGCTVSLSNLFNSSGPTDIADLLFNTIDLVFHSTLMGAAGDLAVQQLYEATQGSYILAVEGGIPTAFNGHTCLLWSEGGRDVTAMEAVKMLAPNAAAVLSIGTCASYGGIPAAGPNPTGVVSVSQLTGVNTVNIPGCPTHPDWIVWTVAHLLAGEAVQLDSQRRPSALYKTSVHDRCPRKEYDEVKTFGVPNRCLKELGCKGPKTRSDCPSRKWNSGENWCIGAGSLCIGCTEQGFPDKFSPFYKLEYEYKPFEKPVEPDPPQPDPDPQPDPPMSTTLSVTRANWRTSKSTLQVVGEGDKGSIVVIANDETGVQLGAVSVNRRGIWRFSQKKPHPIPKKLRITSASQVVLTEVKVRR